MMLGTNHIRQVDEAQQQTGSFVHRVSRVTPRLRSALYVSVGQRLSLTRRADAQRASASLIRLSRPASSMRQRSAMTNSSFGA
jgi:hypothetical protein